MPSTHLPASPGTAYEIRIKDHFDTCWYHRFEGWEITNLENGEVLMRHACVDQPALHGVLNTIRDLNLTLLSVSRLTEPFNAIEKDSN